MSTHPTPPGTCNFTINMPIPLRREAGRVAYMHREAMGRWVRELIEREVVEARVRGALDATGQLVIRLPILALAALGMGAVMWQILSADDDFIGRRMARRVRRRDDVQLVEEC